MAKKKQAKTVKMLSPENYIRQRARTLPIHECLVNSEWEESQMANLIVARKHSNGNITAGLYLVDLLCVGVKDTHWFFNITEFEYSERLERFFNMEGGVTGIKYELAHNIVYSGIEFADDYEFKPHKDFQLLTKYILEEDSEEIPLIEIDCGIDGVPAYMQGPLHTNVQANRVIGQLEQVAGSGNYYLMDEEGRIINDDIVDDGFVEDDEFEDMSMEAKKLLFEDLFLRMNDLNKSETDELISISRSIINDICYNEEYDGYLTGFETELSEIKVDNSEIPNEMLGVQKGGVELSKKVRQQFIDVLGVRQEDFDKQLNEFKKNKGVEAACGYLDILQVEMENEEAVNLKIKQESEKHPNYSLIQLRYAEIIEEQNKLEKYNYNSFFKGREVVHPFEFFNYLHFKSVCIFEQGNLNMLEAWRNVIIEYIDDHIDFISLHGKISMLQLILLAKMFKIQKQD